MINLGLLGFFKYSDFLIGTVNRLLGCSIPLLELPLPIGISFYTFQTMSYTIDCYRGEAKIQKNILDFGVYVTMFPQLIAGPIVKYRDVQEQLRQRKADISAISYGCRRFVAGLAKKVLLANNAGLLWTEISGGNLADTTVLGAWLGVVAYAFQIYFDFSGYSDMAIGLGAILGFHFPENFNYPYVAKSITDFLAQVAYLSERLVSGVCLYPAGRQPQGAAPAAAEYPDRMDADGHMAWGRMEFPAVGAMVCPVAHFGKTGAGAGAKRPALVGGAAVHLAGGTGELGVLCHRERVRRIELFVRNVRPGSGRTV